MVRTVVQINLVPLDDAPLHDKLKSVVWYCSQRSTLSWTTVNVTTSEA